MESTPELVCDVVAELGEGPLWDWRENCLWWVDILGRALHRFDPATGRDDRFDVGQPVGTVVVRRSGGVVLACADGFRAFDPRTGREVSRLRLPAANVTACAFGGDDLRDLYVTTARVGVLSEALRDQPAAGGLFRVRVDAPGVRSAMYAG
jgi:sugar lactone lactonase YvrE